GGTDSRHPELDPRCVRRSQNTAYLSVVLAMIGPVDDAIALGARALAQDTDQRRSLRDADAQ
ncbi:MAG: hypothetical protein ABMA00_19485, partial [Gemmatimonas sp.]